VRASIHTINGFSAHADQQALVAWYEKIAGKTMTFLVHGDAGVMTQFARCLPGARVEMPNLNQSFDL